VNGSLYLKDTKNHRVRVVPLPDVLLSELQAYIDSGYAGAKLIASFTFTEMR
jgi:hypothetical protein